MRTQSVLIAILAAPLMGCVDDVAVDVRGSTVDGVVISADLKGRCFSSVIVQRLDAPERPLVWHVGGLGDCATRESFSYGEAIEGLQTVTAPTPLATSGTYEVGLTGAGFMGVATFDVISGRVVERR